MPTPPKPILNASTADALSGLSRSVSRSWAWTPIVEESLARDIEACSENALEGDSDDENDDDSDHGMAAPLAASAPTAGNAYSLTGDFDFRRASFISGARPALALTSNNREHMSREERRRVLEEERSLLRDNNIIPPKHSSQSVRKTSLGRLLSISRDDGTEGIASGSGLTETSPLLAESTQEYGGQGDAATVKRKWEEAVKEGKIQTTWQREAKTLTKYSLPLMATFLMQYSLTVASIFTIGHIGTAELGAVSLANMTANITGYAVYQGLATSLDTLCSQAYGSGRKKLVGLQMQRMILILWIITIPIAVIWFFAEDILLVIVPEPAVAELAGLYLRVVLLGAPGYAAFEAGKRYMQAQGMFSGSLYVLLFCAPFNAFMNWFLVWRMGIGFVGAPIAVAITDNLLPVGLFIYVRFFSKKGLSCWPGFTKQAWHNWVPMIKLALPGVIMVEAEFLAFEILTFAASYFGVTVLAAQSVLATITSLTFQIPFPLSVAASTRVANLIGATLGDAAKLSTKVALVGAFAIGVLNVVLLSVLKDYIPRLFTSNPDVLEVTSAILPLCAAFQLFDALAALCNGTLRGLGRQHFGGYVQLFCYYVVAMPVSMGTAFGLGWGLWGLWTGVAIALALVTLIEFVYLYYTDWQKCVEEAMRRNDLDTQ